MRKAVVRTQDFLRKLDRIKCDVTINELITIFGSEIVFMQSNDKVQRSMLNSTKRSQLRKIEKLVLEEIEFLVFNVSTKTLPSSITQYRRALKEFNSNHPALFYFKLPKSEYQKRRDEYDAMVTEERNNLIPFSRSKIQPYINKLVSMLSSNDPFDIAVALVGLTGRRPGEILLTAQFLPSVECKYTDNSVIFSGQLKGKGSESARDNYEIPILCDDEQIVINALAKLRNIVDFSSIQVPIEKTLGQVINSKTAPKMKLALKKNLSAFFENIHPHSLRSLYAEICSVEYRPGTVSPSVFFSEVLGHSENNDTVFKSYEDFTIVD